MSAGVAAQRPDEAFRHEALLYDGEVAFLAGALPFMRAGVRAGEPVIVAFDQEKNALLRGELGAEAGAVQFVDVREIGANPARLIPAWRQLIDARTDPGARVWGLGENMWPGRSEAELSECRRHECLVNIAFADVPAISLLCFYDTGSLADEDVRGAHRAHATIIEGGECTPSDAFEAFGPGDRPFADPLPAPRALVRDLAFDDADLAELRQVTARRAHAAGLSTERGEDLVLAVNELATNSIRHGGGEGTLRIWNEPGVLLCEVSDSGRIDDPLAGRQRPTSAQIGGYGLWLANQVCDLVQVSSGAQGTSVRVHMRTA